MKKIIVLLFIVASVPAFATDSLSAKVIDRFTIDFPQAENVKWYENGGNIQVYYTAGDISCNIYYNADGEVTRTRRYYQEKDLAPYIRAKVAQAYAGKKIFGITETSTAKGIRYNIKLEDEKSWTEVVSDSNGQLDAANEMTKM